MKINSDIACKSFFQNNRRFSSLCNAILFQGKEIIEKDNLISYQNEETAIIESLGIKRIRDIIKKTDIHGQYSLIAIENQSSIDHSMPMRSGLYDLLTYHDQYQNQRKLTPVFTIVFYTGESRWKGNMSLTNMMEAVPRELERYFNDYKMILIDVKDINVEEIKDEETRNMIKAIQSIYDVEKKEMEQIRLTKEAALTAGYITKSQWLIEEARQDKEKIDMCEAMERYAKRK